MKFILKFIYDWGGDLVDSILLRSDGESGEI